MRAHEKRQSQPEYKSVIKRDQIVSTPRRDSMNHSQHIEKQNCFFTGHS